MRGSLDTSELQALQQDLYDTQQIDRAISPGLMDAAHRIQSRAQQYAPKDTLELARSIVVQTVPGGVKVTAQAPHAIFLEFGTWQHNIANPRQGTYEIRPVNAQALRFTTSSGEVVFTKKVEHPGVPAYLFLTRAHNEVLSELQGQVGDVAATMLVG